MRKFLAGIIFITICVSVLYVYSLKNKPPLIITPNAELPSSINGFNDSPKIGNDINTSWSYMHDGNLLMREGNYSAATEKFRQAYALQDYVGPLPGYKLIEAYEKNKQYHEAMQILDELNMKYKLTENEHGLENYNSIKSRLTSLKAN